MNVKIGVLTLLVTLWDIIRTDWTLSIMLCTLVNYVPILIWLTTYFPGVPRSEPGCHDILHNNALWTYTDWCCKDIGRLSRLNNIHN